MSVIDEFDPAAVLAEDDRIRAEAEAEQRASRSSELCYRRQENARRAAAAPILDGGERGDVCEVSEFDDNTMALLEGLSMVRAQDLRQWDAIEGALLDKLNQLQREFKMLSVSHQNAQARIDKLEGQLKKSITTRTSNLEKNTKMVLQALSTKTTRIGELEAKVKGLSEVIAGGSPGRDLESRIGYLETLMSTVFRTPSLS